MKRIKLTKPKTVKPILEEIDPPKKKKIKKTRKSSLDSLAFLCSLIVEQNVLLRKNTFYTGGGFVVGGVALVISLIALLK
jgi:hypothetical protein